MTVSLDRHIALASDSVEVYVRLYFAVPLRLSGLPILVYVNPGLNYIVPFGPVVVNSTTDLNNCAELSFQANNPGLYTVVAYGPGNGTTGTGGSLGWATLDCITTP
jgi:hypothetical protein